MIPFSRKIVSNFDKLSELVFFPSQCHLCSTLLEIPKERIICRFCFAGLKPGPSSFCLCCGKFFHSGDEPHLCLSCLQKKPSYSCHRSCGSYSGKLRDVILLFKYRKFKVLGRELASFARKTLEREESLWWEADALIAVPLHPKRERQRGFNQARVLARELSKMISIDFQERSLIKVKNVLPQTSLEAKERKKNVTDAFRTAKNAEIKGRTFVLIDDVYTTGATIQECSRVLIQAGAKEVRALTIARA